MPHNFDGNKNNAVIHIQEEIGKISAVTSIGTRQIDDSIFDRSVDDMLNAINAGNKTALVEDMPVKEEAPEEEKTGTLRRHNFAALEERLKLEKAERKRREEEEKAREEALRLKQEKLRRLNPLSIFKKKQDMKPKEQEADYSAAEEDFREEVFMEEKSIGTAKEESELLQRENPEKDILFHDADTKDPLTGFLNKEAYDALKTQDVLGQSVILVQVKGMDNIKSTFGQSACSLTLITVSREIEKNFTESTCCHIGNDRFAVLPFAPDNTFKKIFNNIRTLKASLAQLSENDMIPYSISTGYCVAGKSLPFIDAVQTAEKILQEEILGTDTEEIPVKEQQTGEQMALSVHMQTHDFTQSIPLPESDMEEPDLEEKPLSEAEYDERLTPAQRKLRAGVISLHSQPTLEQIEAVVNMIEAQYDRVGAVFMSDSAFRTLCIFRNVDTFIDTVKKAGYDIDYSYCYVLLENDVHCYGNDMDNSEVTQIFENLSDALKSGKINSEEDITKINGINIFSNIMLE